MQHTTSDYSQKRSGAESKLHTESFFLQWDNSNSKHNTFLSPSKTSPANSMHWKEVIFQTEHTQNYSIFKLSLSVMYTDYIRQPDMW